MNHTISSAPAYEQASYMPTYTAPKETSPSQASEPVAHTQSPLVTGTSVLGIKYKDGVMLVADCLASYGSLARFRDVERLFKVTDSTLIGTSGDISDLQYIKRQLERLIIREESNGDGHSLGTPQIYEYLCQVMYGRRSKMNPLWNSHVVGGMDEEGKPFLGFVNLQGTTYQSTTIATGFGAHLSQPLLRKAVEGREDQVTEEEARKLLDDCMRVLFYRDARSMNKFQRATITAQGIHITEPYGVDTEWAFGEGIRGYGAHQM